MKDKKNPLSKKIKIAMLDSGLNQTQLAKEIGISRQSLSEWLSSCENHKLENIKKLRRQQKRRHTVVKMSCNGQLYSGGGFNNRTALFY